MNYSVLSDEELMEMYQAGTEEALQVLYRRHSDKVYGFLRSKVWNDERAAELFQETFLKLHRSKHLYNKSLPALPWIFSITRSVLIDGLRIDKKAKRDGEYQHEPAAQLEQRALSEVTELFSRLPEKQRQAVEMRFIDEKTFEEIASRLETTSQNARKLVSRAIAKLKTVAGRETKP